MSSIKEKTILITGGASGIGRLLGRKLLNEGAKRLIIWDVDETKLSDTTHEFKSDGFDVHSYVVDISSANNVIETAVKVREDVGNIDILINNAGVVVGKEFVKHTHNDIDTTINVNTLAMMHTTLEFLPDMIRRGDGHIVNIASAASYVSNPKMSVYAGSKWAVYGWSESLRLELEALGNNLHVTTVTPYYINTGMFDGVKSRFLLPILDPDNVVDSIIKAIKKNKLLVRKPFMIKITPLAKGILPTRVFDLFVGKILGVYKSMDDFIGHKDR
jgi:all-trans-retinol dehydrogenase (NAD+)